MTKSPLFLSLALIALFQACQAPKAQEAATAQELALCQLPNPAPIYAWKPQASQTLCSAIPSPKGYARAEHPKGSFAEWLRYLPLQTKGSPVLLFNGQTKPYQDGAYQVLDIDIGQSDLQQCADAIMRLKAEYLYAKKDYTHIHFNYTSGHKVAFSDWAQGKKPIVKGNSVSFSAPHTNKPDYSYPNFKKYLQNVFMFAGTASLEKESPRRELKELQAGDIFIKGGFPGHAVLVLDVCTNAQGHKLFLLAQSYMPAQSIHVLHNFKHGSTSPWYPIDFGAELFTPEWTFVPAHLRRLF